MAAVEERIDRLEDALTSFIQKSERWRIEDREALRKVLELTARTDAELLRMRQQAEKDRQQAEKDRKDFNKHLAEVSDSMGTLVEDMVVPNAERIATQIFGDDPVVSMSQRVRRKRGGENMEVDLLVAGNRHVMVVESKRRIRPEDADAFLLKAKRLPEFFPEFAGCRIVPVLASVTIEPSILSNLTRRKIYALAFGDETMEIRNLGQF